MFALVTNDVVPQGGPSGLRCAQGSECLPPVLGESGCPPSLQLRPGPCFCLECWPDLRNLGFLIVASTCSGTLIRLLNLSVPCLSILVLSLLGAWEGG